MIDEVQVATLVKLMRQFLDGRDGIQRPALHCSNFKVIAKETKLTVRECWHRPGSGPWIPSERLPRRDGRRVAWLFWPRQIRSVAPRCCRT